MSTTTTIGFSIYEKDEKFSGVNDILIDNINIYFTKGNVTSLANIFLFLT